MGRSSAPAADPKQPTLVRLLGKHQLSSLFTTAVDFAVMILAVELLHVSPVVGTVLGATGGAITNFTLGRYWTFRATAGDAPGQALRYGFVSGGSLGFNALGVYLLGTVLGVYYIAARVVTAVLVSFLWNFPMQRYFVFRLPPRVSS